MYHLLLLAQHMHWLPCKLETHPDHWDTVKVCHWTCKVHPLPDMDHNIPQSGGWVWKKRKIISHALQLQICFWCLLCPREHRLLIVPTSLSMDISIIREKHLKHCLDHIDNRIQIILQIGKGAQINILLRATSHLTFQDLWALFLNLVDPKFIIDSQKTQYYQLTVFWND